MLMSQPNRERTALSRRTVLAMPVLFLPAQDYAEERARLVRESMEQRGIRDAAVLRAMRETPRHEFVPEDVRRFAYQDRPLPIGLGQTISQPSLVALMTELLEIGKNHRVLEIGTGSGYQAAVLAALAKQVYTIEIVPELAASSAATLKRLGYRNIVFRSGNGYAGWPEQAPFDRIILTAAPPELPQALADQLAGGGRLVAPVGRDAEDQQLILLEKDRSGRIKRRSVSAVRFVPMVQAPGAR